VVVLACTAACGFEHGSLGPSVDAVSVDGPDAQADSMIDAAPLVCPTSYSITIASTKSVYRVIATTAPFATQHQACNTDQSGDTHLASIETATEASELQVALGATASTNYYIGVVQKPSQNTVTEGWFAFTGADLPDDLWASGQPNDDAPGESNEENLAALNPTDLLHDATGDVAYPAICECDGLPIDPTVATYIP
jgi:hypothetical protein